MDNAQQFKLHLIREEKSEATVEKYVRDTQRFLDYANGEILTKELAMEYKEYLCKSYAPTSVNSIISSLNCFFVFIGRYDLKLKSMKLQRQVFAQKEKELVKTEYERLLNASKDKKHERINLIMQTICSSGIRVSELRYITMEAIEQETAIIRCKSKIRRIFLPKDLCKMLKKYAKEKQITEGPIFITKSGQPINRSNIWHDMKKLCESAKVDRRKVFPHNLRHLFARTYYTIQKDIVRLSDILGHSSIDTTRIYTIESGVIHRQQIQKLGLLRL